MISGTFGRLSVTKVNGSMAECTCTCGRKDNDGPYSKENCRWATKHEQASNKRNNHKVTVGESSMSIAEVARLYAIPYDRLKYRIRAGWPIEEAIHGRGSG